MKHAASVSFCSLIVAFLCSIVCPQVLGQITVTSANPNSASQGTVNLNVTVSGSGFKKGATAKWFVTGTTNPGGVTVNSTQFKGSSQVIANITVATDAATGNFDIQVTNTDGRSGKGTELFAVNSSNKQTCAPPAPINPVVNSCTSSTAQTGCIDSTFGNNGASLVLDTTLGVQGAIRLQPQPDGTQKIIVFNQTGSAATVWRFNVDGTVDSTFGTGGSSSGGTGLTVYDGVIDANGNILATGNGPGLFVIRFLPNGGVDTSFGNNGLFTYLPSSSGWANGRAVGLQPDGKILAVGNGSTGGSSSNSVVVRLNPNGTLDSTFGSGGVTSFVPPGAKNGALLMTVAIQTVGTTNYIVTGGGGWFGRLTPSGVIDSTFGSGGQVVGPACGGTGNARSTYVDASGNLFLLGYSNLGIVNGVNYITLSKYTAAGVLDTTFGDPTQSGHAGDTVLNPFGGASVPGFNSSLVAATNSSGVTQLLVAGQAQTTGTGSTAYSVLARYGLDGTLDPTYPVAARTFGSGAAWGMGTVVEPTGEIVPFIIWDNSGGYLALTRYWP